MTRTYLFDEIIKQHVAEGYDRVLNLAAGLDTRPYRLPLPDSLEWVEADLPEMIAYKQSILKSEKPNCRLVRMSVDLADRKQRLGLLEHFADKERKTLVIAEGLIIYLMAEQAAELATDLSERENICRWAFDLSSPILLAMAQKEMGPALQEGNVEFKFGPEEGEYFFQAHGWKWLQSWSKLKTAASLNRLSPEMMDFSSLPEPEGPRRTFPWSGVCLFENKKSHLII